MRHLRRLGQHMGCFPLTAITHDTVDQYKRARLAEGVKPASVNNELFHLNVLLSWAAENNLVGAALKCKPFPPKMTNSALPEMPTSAQFEAIIDKVRPEVRGIAMLEFYAGCGIRRR